MRRPRLIGARSAGALRLLFWLKWTLMWRVYQRSTSVAVGAIVAVVLIFPVSVLLAVGCGAGFLHLDPPRNEHLLRGVLLGIYLLWVLVPLFGYALSDAYDITRLFVYPLTARQLFAGALLGALVDFPVLFVLPTLIAAVVGFTKSAAGFVFVTAALALFLVHTLSLTQAIMLLSAGILRSRRFRDAAIVLVSVFWIVYYVASQSLARRAVQVDWSQFLRSGAWEAISLLPPGAAARSVAAASRGDLVLSAAFLLLLAVVAAATIALAGWALAKVYAGEWVSGPGRRRSSVPARVPERGLAQARKRRSRAAGALLGGRLPPVVAAIAEKELRYYIRDPYFKVVLMNLVYMLFVGAFMLLRPSSHGLGQFSVAMVWGATGMVLLSEMQLLFNIFGVDGGAASVLFLFPSSRQQILLGKNLTLFAALSLVNLGFMAILAALARAMHLLGPLFCWMELALVLLIAVGNLCSIWFPSRVGMRGWRTHYQSAGRRCGYGLLYMALSVMTAVLLIPVLAALLVPILWAGSRWLALTVPLAIVYTGGLYALSLRAATLLLLDREVELIARLGQET